MKLVDGLILKQIANQYLVIPVGAIAKDFNGMGTLNSVGAFMWGFLEKGITREQLIAETIKEYEIDEKTASADVDRLISQLKEAKLVK